LVGEQVFLAFGIVLGIIQIGGDKPAEPQGLTLHEEKYRIVINWKGPVEPPMLKVFQDTFRKLDGDPRRIVLSLNSPGGSVQHGHQVIEELRRAGKMRPIDTMVEAGHMCGSMCVPLYLTGITRAANPHARFMFHEVSFRLPPQTQRRSAIWRVARPVSILANFIKLRSPVSPMSFSTMISPVIWTHIGWKVCERRLKAETSG
jgi:hypothetical protein